MSSKNPITYFDYFFNAQNDAHNALQEQTEQELAPYLANIIQEIRLEGDLPPSIQNLFTAMANPPHPSFGNAMAGFLTGTSTNVANGFLGAALQSYQYKMAELFSSLRIDAPTASLLWQRKKITKELFDSRMTSQGFKPAEGLIYYEATQPYPNITDIIKWARYQGSPDNPKGSVYSRMEIDDDDFDLWLFLTTPQLEPAQLQALLARDKNSVNLIENKLSQLGYTRESISVLKELSYSIPDPSTMIQSGMLNDLSRQEILDTIIKSGVHPDYANKYINAVTQKPSIQDVVEWLLRSDYTLSLLPQELRRIGVNENYFELYKTLAHVVPPIQDIITMAVREAFSPAVASRFGQYEDFPEAFATYAAQKGLSKEWAERYWAAHWSLPSPQQGFEMLHRGIIGKEDLNLLLKALDIMPFWRDKLTQMAYNTYTRIDVRRMYALGVMDKAAVKKAYIEMGYEDTKAETLMQYTVEQQLASIGGLNSKSAVTAYAKSLITSAELTAILQGLGLKYDEVQRVIKDANYKREWEIKDLKISAIQNQYKKKAIEKNAAISQLLSLAIPAEQVNLMLDKWEYSEKEEKVTLWTTAQTLSLYKKGMITINRAESELIQIGFNTERRNALLAMSTPTT